MDNFLAFLMGLGDLISDFFQYIFHELRTDRRRLLQAILGVIVLVFVINGVRSVVTHTKKNAERLANEPESQMVLPISVAPTPTTAPATETVASGAAAVTTTAPVAMTGTTGDTVGMTGTTGTLGSTGTIGSALNVPSGAGTVTVGNITVVNEYVQRKGTTQSVAVAISPAATATVMGQPMGTGEVQEQDQEDEDVYYEDDSYEEGDEE